jgi:hypothetical protein
MIAVMLAMLSPSPAWGADPTALDVSASLVTLHAQSAPLADALRQIAPQAHVPVIRAFAANTATVTCDFDAETFWTVMTSLMQQSNTAFGRGADGGLALTTRVNNNSEGSGIFSIDRAFLFTATRVHRVFHFDMAPGLSDFADMSVTSRCEPRLSIYSVSNPVIPTSATDDTGLSLVPSPEALAASTVQSAPISQPVQSFAARLAVPEHAGRIIQHVKGDVTIWMARNREKLTLTDQSPAIARSILGQTLTITPSSTRGFPGLTVAISKDGPVDDATWRVLYTLPNGVSLTAASGGRQLPPHNSSTNSAPNGTLTAGRYFQLPPGGGEVTYSLEIPTDLEPVVAHFDFANVPVP